MRQKKPPRCEGAFYCSLLVAVVGVEARRAKAVGAVLQQGRGVASGFDAARGLHADVVTHGEAHQTYAASGGAGMRLVVALVGRKPGRGFDERSTCASSDEARQHDFFVAQLAGFENHLHRHA